MRVFNALSSAEGLADSMRHIRRQAWPELIIRFQDMLDLQGCRASIHLTGNQLVLSGKSGEHVVEIASA